MYASGIGTTSRNQFEFTNRTIGVVEAALPPGPTSAPGWTLRSVTTPSNGAVVSDTLRSA